MKILISEPLSFAAQPIGWQGRLHQPFTLGPANAGLPILVFWKQGFQHDALTTEPSHA